METNYDITLAILKKKFGQTDITNKDNAPFLLNLKLVVRGFQSLDELCGHIYRVKLKWEISVLLEPTVLVHVVCYCSQQ